MHLNIKYYSTFAIYDWGITMYSNQKTEEISIHILQERIDEIPSLISNFNSMDKAPAWDGDIYCYNSNNTEKKENLKVRIPVQIKGHYDKNQRYIFKNRVKCQVSIDDLRLYGTEKCTIYFSIYFADTKDGRKKEIFYKLITPAKVKEIFLQCKRNQKMVTLCFNKFPHGDDILKIIDQFIVESMNQGSIDNSTVINAIEENEFKDIDHVVVIKSTNISLSEYLKGLESGDFTLYGKREENLDPVPIIGTEFKNLKIDGFFDGVILNGKKYFSQVAVTITSEKAYLKFDDFLQFSDNEAEFNFINPQKMFLSDYIYGLRFISELKKSGSFKIDDSDYKINISDQFSLEKYNIYFELYDLLNEIRFPSNIPVTQLMETSEDLKKLLCFKRWVVLHVEDIKNDKSLTHWYWSYDGRYLPFIIKIDDSSNVHFINTVYDPGLKKVAEYNGNSYEIPAFLYNDINILSNLYQYKFDALKLQIKNASYNEYTNGLIIRYINKLILVYDNNPLKSFLDLAELMLEKIKDYIPEDYYLIIKFQIQIRITKLSESDLRKLEKIETEYSITEFGKNLLLNRREKALEIYSHLDQNDKEIDYFIMALKNIFDQ